jgi:hypothetical protein
LGGVGHDRASSLPGRVAVTEAGGHTSRLEPGSRAVTWLGFGLVLDALLWETRSLGRGLVESRVTGVLGEMRTPGWGHGLTGCSTGPCSGLVVGGLYEGL